MIALLKLKNGIEVIGTVNTKARDYCVMDDPFIINYRFVSGQPMPTISLSRYVPFAATHSHSFMNEDVMHYVTPSEALELYYQQALEYCKEVVDKSVDEELLGAAARKHGSGNDLLDVYTAILERTNYQGPLN